MIDGTPYLEGAMMGALVMILLFRLAAGKALFMSLIFGNDESKTKKEPLTKATERNI